jgi:hypothetical protein
VHTFAELGAFAAQEDLRRKLLPILDRKHQSDDSFLNTGPVSWTDKDSKLSPAIHADFDAILLCGTELDSRLNKVPRVGYGRRLREASTYPKILAFLLADLALIAGPAPFHVLEEMLEGVTGVEPDNSFEQVAGLSATLGLIHVEETGRNARIVRRPPTSAASPLGPHLLRSDFVDAWRARIVTVLLRFPDWRSIALSA